MSEPKQQIKKLVEQITPELKNAVIDAVTDCAEEISLAFWLGTFQVFMWGDCIKSASIEELEKEAEELFNNSKDPEERECWLETATRLEEWAQRMRNAVK